MTSDDDTSSKGSNKKDPTSKYNFLKDLKDTNSVTCLFCGKETKGGIFRAKQHKIGKKGNAARCLKCPEEVREEFEQYMINKRIKKTTIVFFLNLVA